MSQSKHLFLHYPETWKEAGRKLVKGLVLTSSYHGSDSKGSPAVSRRVVEACIASMDICTSTVRQIQYIGTASS